MSWWRYSGREGGLRDRGALRAGFIAFGAEAGEWIAQNAPRWAIDENGRERGDPEKFRARRGRGFNFLRTSGPSES